MKKIYDIRLIEEYINGDDIVDYDIDTLEDDWVFMRQAISYTNDKKLYYLCSDNVKANPLFIKFLILSFKNDIKFIEELANFYLDKINIDNITNQEIVVLISNIMSKYYGKDIDNKLINYSLMANYIYQKYLMNLERRIENFITIEEINNMGLGFKYVIYDYQNSKIMLDFFAEKYLYDLFHNRYSDKSLEQLIHLKYRNLNELKNDGLDKCLFYIIEEYDSYLKDYVSNNSNILNSLLSNMELICSNWDNYINNLNNLRIAIFYQEVDKYFYEHGDDLSFSETELISCLFDKLDLDKFFTVRNSFKLDLDNIDYGINNLNLLTIDDCICINKMTKMTETLFSKDAISPIPFEIEENKKEEISKVKGRIKRFRINIPKDKDNLIDK